MSDKLITVGVLRGDGEKDYRIHYSGETFYLTKTGNRFECSGVVGTIKEIKQKILTGQLDDSSPHAEQQSDQIAATDGPCHTKKTWDCVDPCALLTYLVEYSNLVPGGQDIYLQTLDCYGWLDEHGRPDVPRAVREVKRVKRNADGRGEDAKMLPVQREN